LNLKEYKIIPEILRALVAAAAFALGQISHPKAAESLGRFIDDRDPRVREIARKVQESPIS
jgi:HEAT repeat protein